MIQADWDDVRSEVTRHLQELLRIDTTNPPGNEIAAADYLARVLTREGYEPAVLESEPGRASLVARLTGTGEDAPLLLMCHTDVVPAEADQWRHPPFGGELHDGVVWGRGAVDMKGTVAVFLTLMLLFKRQQAQGAAPFRRDVIFMAAADEERGGHLGAGWLVDNHPDLIRAEYAINEGGGRGITFGDNLYYTCQTAEKGYARFKLTARGNPGHGSMPRHENAVVRLAETVARVGRATLPTHVTDTVRAYVTAIAEDQPDPLRADLLSLLDAERTSSVLPELDVTDEQRRTFYALTRNTATPTVLEAGGKVNVIPSAAVGRVDGRLLPGFDRETFLAELDPFLDEQVELEFLDWGPPLESPQESPLFDAIVSVMEQREPDATLVPAMITGGTDAKHVVRLGTKVYGFTPTRWHADRSVMGLAHAHDERLSVDDLVFRTEVLYDVISKFAHANAQ